MKPGTILSGKYRLESVLGQGGMGSVWRAEHLGLKAPVAVKLMDPTVTQNADALGRFHREAHAAAMIRSPHVVQVLDHGVDEAHRTPFIVMELLEGETLGERLLREQVLSPERTAAILGDVCRALSRAHQAGIIHRDLKPDNIFLVTDDREYAKVVDFGVAKSRPYSIGGGGTRTGSLIGTPYYMSPEQISGSKQIDGRSDLWSVAVIACECITGRRPFQEETIGGLAIAICTRPVPRALTLAPVSPAFDAWLARALDREPDNRFQSAREQADALRDACAGCDKPIVKMPSGVREGTRFEEPDTLPGKRAPGPTLSGDTLDAAPTGRPAPPDEADSPTAPPLSNTFAALVLKGHPRAQMLSAGAGLGVALAVATWLAVDAGRPLPKGTATAARSGETVHSELPSATPPSPPHAAVLPASPAPAAVAAPTPPAPTPAAALPLAPTPATVTSATAALPAAQPVPNPSAEVAAAIPPPATLAAAAPPAEMLAPHALLGTVAKPTDPAHTSVHAGAGHAGSETSTVPHKRRAVTTEEPKANTDAAPAKPPAHGDGAPAEARDAPDPDIGGPDHPEPPEKAPPQDDPGDAPDSKAAVPKTPVNVAAPKHATTSSDAHSRTVTLETDLEGERTQPKQ